MSSGNRSLKKPKKKQQARPIDPVALHEAMSRRLYRRSIVSGKITVPAVPALLDEYVKMCADVFAGHGRRFAPAELEQARKIIQDKLLEAYEASPRSNIVITYNAPVGTVLHYEICAEIWTVAAAYEEWIGTRTPPLFGTHPDARIWALAEQAADPKAHRVLDIGAGTGRNALALARRGHPVDVVELTPKFAEMISEEAKRDQLDVRVIRRDVFESTDDLRQDYQLILLSEVVSDFRGTHQLRSLFELAARCLAPGATLVFNAFVTRQGYTPDKAARELGQQCYATIFTQHELMTAAADLPLELVADDSVYEYEKAHLPEDGWPPTGWYADWVAGLDVFDVEREKCPIEMRWLVYKKTT
jgi:SAM-dependent methyltransferase